MFGLMSMRIYLVIGGVVSVLFYGLSLIAGQAIRGFIEQTRLEALRAGLAPFITDAVAEPMRLVFSGDLIPAIVGGMMWPIVLLWILLLLIMLIFAFIAPGVSGVRGSLS